MGNMKLKLVSVDKNFSNNINAAIYKIKQSQ